MRVGGDQNTLSSLTSSALTATVDWAAANHAGTYTIPLVITNTNPRIELIDPPTKILVDLDALVSASVPVHDRGHQSAAGRLSTRPPAGGAVNRGPHRGQSAS